MPDIIFNRNTGGLGRPLSNFDHVSGLVFFTSTYPSGFSAGTPIKKINSLAEAEAAGIVNTHIDETAASGGNFNFTNHGSTGDVIELQIDEGEGAYTIATATVETGENNNSLAAKLRLSCNDTSIYSHGYSAAGASANVLLTPPAGLGDSINGGSKLTLKKTPTASVAAATITQFSGGADGFFEVMHYHISEFFRIQPLGVLYVGVFADASFTASRVVDMQNFAAGEIRQLGVFNQKSALATSNVTQLQAQAEILNSVNRPLSILLHSDMTGLTPAGLSNLTTLNSKNVSVVISGDGATTARAVFNKMAFTVSCLGAALGAESLASVHENIGWVQKFNMSDGTNLDKVKFLPSTLFDSLAESTKTQLGNYAYLFLLKYTDLAGSYFNTDKTATSAASDYARIRNVRTVDKAIRGVRAKLLPLLNSPLYVNPNGTLSEATIANFANEANKIIGGVYNSATAEGQMIIDGELSAGRTIIDPLQNVLATSKVVVTLELIPVGSAEKITVNIGLVAQFN